MNLTPEELLEVAARALVIARSSPAGSAMRQRFTELREAAHRAHDALFIPGDPAPPITPNPTPKPKPGPTTTGPHA